MGIQTEITWKIVTKISKGQKEMRMVSVKNERHREKITALSNITEEVIIGRLETFPPNGGGRTH